MYYVQYSEHDTCLSFLKPGKKERGQKGMLAIQLSWKYALKFMEYSKITSTYK